MDVCFTLGKYSQIYICGSIVINLYVIYLINIYWIPLSDLNSHQPPKFHNVFNMELSIKI